MSINFFSQGDKPFVHLDAATSAVPAPAFVGRWCTLEVRPDLFSPQCFSVGVMVQASGRRLHYHLLGEFKKFECIYGAQLPKSYLAELLSHAEEVLRQAVQQELALEGVDFGSPHLHLSVAAHTTGDSSDAIIKRLYRDVVVLAPGPSARVRLFDSQDTASVRRQVNESLKALAGNDFERIVLDAKGGVLVMDGDRTHYLDVNLKTSKACGSVISAVYKTAQIVETNLLRANLDLTTFAKLKHLDDKGVFLMLPEQGQLESDEWERIENVVDEHSWKLQRDGFRVVGRYSAQGLAQEIYDWAKPTL